MVVDDNKTNNTLWDDRNEFSKKIRNTTIGKSKNKIFNNNVSNKDIHSFRITKFLDM